MREHPTPRDIISAITTAICERDKEVSGTIDEHLSFPVDAITVLKLAIDKECERKRLAYIEDLSGAY